MTNVHVLPEGGQSLASDERPEASAREKLPAQFAICSDAAVLMSTADMKGLDLTGRTVWTGVVLTAEETAVMREQTVEHEQEIAAKLIGQLRKARIPRE